ncbi:MAG: hypothetical protein R3B45_09420 [Bdellovibrionota bacterium]
MKEEIFQIADENPEKNLINSQMLVVLARPESYTSLWIKELIKTSYASLQRRNHYFSIDCGFFEANGEKPWMVLQWDHRDGCALERRWLANQAVETLKQRQGVKDLVFWLEPEFELDHLSIIEDIKASFMDPRYTQSSLERVVVMTPDVDRFSQMDPHRDIRMSYEQAYRRWVNENPDELTSLEIGRRLKLFADENACSFVSMNESELKKHGMNLLLAVGQASSRSPSRLHLVSYCKNNDDHPPLLLVGKGITFDTGGINVKHHDNFVNCMKNDMGGAALMANLFMALVSSNFDYPIVLAIPSCENLVAEKSMKPGSIVSARTGKKVIIEHTDAEGRLILADAISYAQDMYKPCKTLVAATLTTAAMRQFSPFFTAVHFADFKFNRFLEMVADNWGENLLLE